MTEPNKPLKEFIAESLWAIYEAVADLQRKAVHETPRNKAQGSWERMPTFAPKLGSEAGPVHSHIVSRGGDSISIVEFDVAVEIGSSSSGAGGAGIMVAGIGIGGKKSSADRAQSVSRIRFAIPVLWPSQSNLVYLAQQEDRGTSD